MTEPIIIEQIDLQGFRGFLEQQSIVISNGKQKNLAIHGPNGNGKSSLVDALEYYFKEGKPTLERLGKRASDKYAGRKFVAHVSAGKNDMMVRIRFRQGEGKPFEGSRTGEPLPNAASRILPLKVSFIIRDYELREFVQNNQYQKLIEWFNLESLNIIQENLRTLKNRINGLKKDKQGEDVLMNQLKTLTGHEFYTGEESEVLKWLNEDRLAEMNLTAKFKKIADDDAAFLELASRSEMEKDLATTSHLNGLLDVIKDLIGWPVTLQEEPTGLIAAFEKAASDFEKAVVDMNVAKSQASDHVFKEVWSKAQELLQNKPELDECPVCKATFTLGGSRSRDAILNNLRVNLDQLDEYDKAEREKSTKEIMLDQTATGLRNKMGEFFRWAGSEYQYGAVTDYVKTLQSWRIGENVPNSIDAVSALANLHSKISNEIKVQSNENTHSNALTMVKRLREIISSLSEIRRTKNNLSSIGDSLEQQAGIINRTIVKHIDDLVDKLKDEAQAINQEIQGPYAPNHPIEIKLAPEAKQNQRVAHVLTNFMNRGEDVPPDGVLSESQNRTLALAIRLAAIRMFNTKFKVIVLDDVTMSYDAERRQHIAALLHKRFSEFQIIVATHDNTFYEALRRRVSPEKWKFLVFEQFLDNYGPIIKGKKTVEAVINERIAKGEPIIGNDMRKAYEEWLSHICAGFVTSLPYKPGKPYELHDYIDSLAGFLHKKKYKVPTVSGYEGNYLDAMKSSKVVNITSHYNPYSNITPEELKTEWMEFSEFKSHFKCSGCGSDRFGRREGERPHCTDCGDEFVFAQNTNAS